MANSTTTPTTSTPKGLVKCHLANLQPGDRVWLGSQWLTVDRVQSFAGLPEVWWTDGTVSPPAPVGAWTWRKRRGRV